MNTRNRENASHRRIIQEKAQLTKSKAKKDNAKDDDVIDTTENDEWVETLLHVMDIRRIAGPIRTSLS